MRQTTTLTRTMLRLFDSFGKVDDKLIYFVPFIMTGDSQSGFRCAIGEPTSNNGLRLTILTKDGIVRSGWLWKLQEDFSVESEEEVKKLAIRISDYVSIQISKICKEEEYDEPEAYVSCYNGKEPKYWQGDDDPTPDWLDIVNDANRTVGERFLGFLDERTANLIRESSLTFGSANLFSKWLLGETAQNSIEKAVKQIPSVIGPVLTKKDMIDALIETGDVFRAMSVVMNADEATFRFLGLLDKEAVRNDDLAGPVIAAIASLPVDLLATVQSTTVAESLWAALEDIVLKIRWAFCMEHDGNAEFLNQSCEMGWMAARVIQRDGLLHDIIARGHSFESNFWDTYDIHEDIADIALQAFVLPHLPDWLFVTDKRKPESSTRLRSTVGANLFLWTGLKEADALAEKWNEPDDERLGTPRTSEEDQDLIRMCSALLEKVMPGMTPSARAWALVSNPYALSILDSSSPSVEGSVGNRTEAGSALH